MTLEEYYNRLKKFVEENPQHKDKQVIHAKDDEGNGYHRVIFWPGTPGKYDGDWEFDNSKEIPESEINAICIN